MVSSKEMYVGMMTGGVYKVDFETNSAIKQVTQIHSRLV